MISRTKLTIIFTTLLILFLFFLIYNQQISDDIFYYKVVLEDENNHPVKNTEVKLAIANAPTIITEITDNNGIVVFTIASEYKDEIAVLFVAIDDYKSVEHVIFLDDDGRSNRLWIERSEHSIATIQTQEAPTSTPIPMRTLTVVPTDEFEESESLLIASIDNYSLQNGMVENTFELKMNSFGLGEMDLTYPITMSLNQSSLIHLVIHANEDLALLPKVTVSPPVSVSRGIEPNDSYSISDEIQLYPAMEAKLGGNDFDIYFSDQAMKPVISDLETVWDWSVTPRKPGKQSLILTISVPILINNEWKVLQAQPLKSIPIDVNIEVSATPPPTKTPVPTSTLRPSPTSKPTETVIPTATKTNVQEITDSITTNADTFIIGILTLIFGIPATVIFVARYRREINKDKQDNELPSDWWK